MPTITIDGQEINVAPGTTIIQAAEKLGIYIPRYCYHPALSIAGSCRMCLVEIENVPKLQISCYTPAQDGMKVHTATEKVRRARQAMLEFLLINHPLDCPVCDQSGECDLQNFYMEYGRYDSRFLENKIKRKKAHPIGPHVILDQERCILCSRCVRFCEEVTGTHELGVFRRGNRSIVDLCPGKTLDNPYSANVVDICPVGALTEREFRFKCRVWYLSVQNSICTGCARGCNLQIHFNQSRPHHGGGARVMRLKPRFNPFVNRWWLCDEGRFGYRFIDQNRIEHPSFQRAGNREISNWESTLQEVATALRTAYRRFGPRSIGVVASPQLANEDLYLIRRLFVENLELTQVGYRNSWEKEGVQDDLLVRADRNPNGFGAEIMGFTADVASLLRAAACGDIKVLYVFHHDFQAEEARGLLTQAPYVVFQGTNWNQTAEAAHVVLPSATHAEKEGTFTNFEGRVQRFAAAFQPLEESRPDSRILLELAQRLGLPMPFASPGELFREWRGKGYDELDEFGELISRV